MVLTSGRRHAFPEHELFGRPQLGVPFRSTVGLSTGYRLYVELLFTMRGSSSSKVR
jgi:hypothetical protein